jgi:alpha-ribazole phosphatase
MSGSEGSHSESRVLSGSPAITLYLVRHGETEWGRRGIAYGHSEASLTDLGREQSRGLCELFAPIALQAVYSSDLERTRAAADCIASSHDLPLVAEPWLREINMGEWEGRKIAEIMKSEQALVDQMFGDPSGFCFPAGEGFTEFFERVWKGVNEILASQRGGVAIVTHAGVLRMIIGGVLELAPKNWLKIAQDFGCINIIEWYDGGPIVKKMNGFDA